MVLAAAEPSMAAADSHIAEVAVDIVVGTGGELVRKAEMPNVTRRGQERCRFLLGSSSSNEGTQCAARGVQRLPKDLGGR